MKPREFFYTVLAVFLLIYIPAEGSQWFELMTRAATHADNRNYDSAIALCEMALADAETEFGPQDTLLIDIMIVLGKYLIYDKNYNAAESTFILSLEMANMHFEEINDDSRRLHNCLGTLYNEQGHIDKALKHFYLGLEMSEKIYGENHPNIAIPLHNIAQINSTRGFLRQAEVQFERTLGILERNLEPEDLIIGMCFRNIAVLYERQGRLADAERLHRRTLEIRQKGYGHNDPITANTILDLANLYAAMGRSSEAEENYLKAIEIWNNTVGPEDLYVARGSGFLGEFYLEQGRFQEAEESIRNALAINEAKLGAFHPNVGHNIRKMARLYSKQGQFAEAEQFLLRALEIQDSLPESSQLSTVYLFNSIGEFYLEYGRLQQAESYLTRSLSMLKNIYGGDHYPLSGCYKLLSRLSRTMGDSAKAIEYAHREAGIRSRVLYDDIATMSEKNALTYSQFSRKALDNMLSCYFDYQWQDTAIKKSVMNLIQFNKGLVSDCIFTRQRSARLNNNPETALLLDSLRSLKFELSNIFTSASGKNTETYKQHVDSLDKVIRQLEGRLSLACADLQKWKDYENFGIDKLLSLLPENGTIIDYYQFKYIDSSPDSAAFYYLALAASRNSDPAIIPLGPADEIDALIDTYRRHMMHIASLGGVTTDDDRSEYVRISRALYEKIWKPLEHLAANTETIIISPEASLNTISFAGIIDQKGDYLIEKHTVNYLSSGRDLIRAEEEYPAGKGLFAIGDPDYNATVTQRASAYRPPDENTVTLAQLETANVRSACQELNNVRLSRLPESREEIETVADTWMKYYREPIEIRMGIEASEDFFKSEAPGSRVIHLATHGYYLQGMCFSNDRNNDYFRESNYIVENPMLLSGLFLAGANVRPEISDRAGMEDGILTACEVSALDLSGTELVALSACETGLGELMAGEGVFGLRRAFQMAGARTIISTLWMIPDQLAKEIFSQLYERHDNSPARKMRQIQLDKISNLRKQGKNDHPYNWDGVVVFDDRLE